MASVNYLREKFSKLQTEEERTGFCYKILDAEYFCHSQEEQDRLPEGSLQKLWDHLRAALEAEGRGDLFEPLEKARKIASEGMQARK